MNETQKKVFLFALAAFIGTTAFNATSFVMKNDNQFAAAIQFNKTLMHKSGAPVRSAAPLTQKQKIDTEVPTDVEASWVPQEDGTDKIIVIWKGTATGDNGYSVYRKTATSEEYELIKNVSASVTTFFDKNIVPDTTYTYKVKTWTSGFSQESNPARIGPKEESVETIFGEIEL